MRSNQSKHAKYKTNNPISNYLVSNFLKNINNILRSVQFDSLLDVGCGEGMLLSNANNIIQNKKCFAIDLDENEVKDAIINLPFCKVQVGSVYEIPFNNDELDLVICTEVLEHLEEPEKALHEIYRVTKKYALLSVPREPVWRLLNIARFSYLKDLGNTPGHLNNWSTNGFKEFVSSDFNIVTVSKPLPWTVILAKK